MRSQQHLWSLIVVWTSQAFSRKVSHDQRVLKTKLRFCNAYVSSKDLTPILDGDAMTPLKYKQCKESEVYLTEGTELAVQVDGKEAGTFTVSGLPSRSDVLVLVVQRTSVDSSGASFKSHVFNEDMPGVAQVAIFDAFTGNMPATQEVVLNSTSVGPEALPLNSVVTVNPGAYKLSLTPAGNVTYVPSDFKADEEGLYVFMRTGRQSMKEWTPYDEFREELVVFPSCTSGKHANLAMALMFVLLTASTSTSLSDTRQ